MEASWKKDVRLLCLCSRKADSYSSLYIFFMWSGILILVWFRYSGRITTSTSARTLGRGSSDTTKTDAATWTSSGRGRITQQWVETKQLSLAFLHEWLKIRYRKLNETFAEKARCENFWELSMRRDNAFLWNHEPRFEYMKFHICDLNPSHFPRDEWMRNARHAHEF